MSEQVDWAKVPVVIVGTPCEEGLEALRRALEDFSFQEWQEQQAEAPSLRAARARSQPAELVASREVI